MDKPAILVVDDEASMLELIEYNLKREGYEVLLAKDGEEALRTFREKPVSLIILDIMMPGIDGLDVCREIRRTSSVPIIMLTAKEGETNKIVGLELGADDYVTKPFLVGELIARVKAVLRRAFVYDSKTEGEDPDILSHGDIKIFNKRREVFIGSEKFTLTTREFDLLHFLASNPGTVFTREQILDRVWGNKSFVVDRAVDVHIRHLREKIEANPESPQYIKTVRGVGYRFGE